MLQNDIGNRFSPTVIVAAITAQIQKAKLPTHVEIDAKRYGFDRNSVILLEQIRTLDKQRLTDKITKLDDEMMEKINHALEISLGLKDMRSEEHTSELQSRFDLVCRLLLEKQNLKSLIK